MSKRIAIVEDEQAIRENYAAAFRREGYAVDLYEARQPAMDAFDARLPDLVVIDINLKDEIEGGFELCRTLRSRSSDLPIIFLTARDSEFDAVSGLRLGPAHGRDTETAGRRKQAAKRQARTRH
jgi:two-component system OmpR family response regulator